MRLDTTTVDYDLSKYERYEELPAVDEAKKALEFRLVRELVGKNIQKGHALDIGTATGRYATLLAGSGYEVIGIDVCRTALSVTESKLRRNGLYGKVQLRQMNAVRLDLPEDYFDVVTCMMGTLSHMSLPEQQAALREISRVLRPGGWVIVTVWNPECSFTNFLSIYDENERALLRANSPPARDLIREMEKLHFSHIKVHPICCFADVQLCQLVNDQGDSKPLSDLQRYARSLFPRLQGQLYAVVGHEPATALKPQGTG